MSTVAQQIRYTYAVEYYARSFNDLNAELCLPTRDNKKPYRNR